MDPLAHGWNTWDTRSVLTHVLLPECLSLKLAFCHYGMLTIVDDTAFGRKALRATAGVKLAESEISDRSIRVNAGAHSPDGAYTMLTVEIGSVFIQVESAHVGERDLVILSVRNRTNRKHPR